MPRVKKPTKVKEPVRLRTKKLADGSQSLYLDIYRFGKRTYEYLKLYLIPETDNNARRQNQATMNAANAIKSKRIIELTNGEAGIETKERVYLLDWMNTYTVSYTHLRAHETKANLVCRLLLEKKNK